MNKANFWDLMDLAASETSGENPRDLVGKEILHYDILHVMALGGFLNHLVFHGGTALRLCHGSVRLSEDLDFCGELGFTGEKAAGLVPVDMSCWSISTVGKAHGRGPRMPNRIGKTDELEIR